MTDNVGPLSPHDKKMYEQEYRHGADLFQRALEQYNKAENPYQKNEFKSVMDKAMNVMNETAQALMRKELLQQNDKISQDYAAFQDHPDAQSQKELAKDLDRAKRAIG
jgi:hypothetical protein